MDKKQKKMFVSILMIVVLIALLIGFTFAKYYSSYSGKASLQVAKWSFKVNDWSTSETKQISLLDTESQVVLEDGKIAPGFDGRVDLELDAKDSEVDVEYYVEATENGHKPSNLVFKAIVDGEETTAYSSLDELAKSELKGTILKSDSEQVRNITICCVWPYETVTDETTIAEEDIEDTLDGTVTSENQQEAYDYTFSLRVVGTQARTTT